MLQSVWTLFRIVYLYLWVISLQRDGRHLGSSGMNIFAQFKKTQRNKKSQNFYCLSVLAFWWLNLKWLDFFHQCSLSCSFRWHSWLLCTVRNTSHPSFNPAVCGFRNKEVPQKLGIQNSVCVQLRWLTCSSGHNLMFIIVLLVNNLHKNGQAQ